VDGCFFVDKIKKERLSGEAPLIETKRSCCSVATSPDLMTHIPTHLKAPMRPPPELLSRRAKVCNSRPLSHSRAGAIEAAKRCPSLQIVDREWTMSRLPVSSSGSPKKLCTDSPVKWCISITASRATYFCATEGCFILRLLYGNVSSVALANMPILATAICPSPFFV